MIMFDIAEWIANILVLGIGVFIWVVTIFMVAMLVSMSNKWIQIITKHKER